MPLSHLELVLVHVVPVSHESAITHKAGREVRTTATDDLIPSTVCPECPHYNALLYNAVDHSSPNYCRQGFKC